ncbi:hypothetical protein [Halapricum hydrolyticum]|uniref:Big-1 domain-containing protein n=1 Tax=Halapricum hydrolyticum TaxID=2979991 RepID=A0AAE3LEA3_9EURY|nr:hypothetical protein [Halapricum hydrolyticum]MCU4717165.1 hypothetical protein [Halapricum hydrolyticum]MCU4726092.1 hypothetical protein [Halapricum hydrolyticum]
MQFRGDCRGQAIQIGAVLLLGAIVLSFAIYQSTVVPEQNREIEFQHSQTVGDQLQDARNAIVSTGSTGSGQSVAVTLGTQYPSRIVAMNPGPPSGTLSTVGTTNGSITATIANANATGETGDFWTGANRSYNTGALVYRPGYNEYDNAPTTWYEHSVLFDQFRDANLTTTGQQLVDGTTISLVTLNGTYQASRTGSVSLDMRGASVSSQTVSVTNATADSNVTITLPTRLDEENWEELLDGERHVVDVRTSSVTGADYELVHVVLEQGVTYDLQLSRVGLGTGVVKPEPAYLTRVSKNTPTVPEGGKVEVTVEVRDRFDNPKRDVEVIAGTNRRDSSVSPNSTDSDGDGQVTVTYEAPNVSGASQRTDHVQLSLDTSLSSVVNESGFNGSTPVNVSVPVRVDNSDGSGLADGSDSAYSIDWTPDTSQDGFTETNGVYVVDASRTDTVDLTAETTPTAQNASVDFSLNDSSVGTLTGRDSRTNDTGQATTTFDPNNNGPVAVFVASGGSGDRIGLVVENATETAKQQLQPDTVQRSDTTLNFTIENTGSQQVTIEQFSVDTSAITTGNFFDNDNALEVEIRGGQQDGEANRGKNENPSSFEADGTAYDLVADSNKGNDGQYAILNAGDRPTIVMETFDQPLDGGGSLQFTPSETAADVIVTFVLSDGTEQVFYFEQQ